MVLHSKKAGALFHVVILIGLQMFCCGGLFSNDGAAESSAFDAMSKDELIASLHGDLPQEFPVSSGRPDVYVSKAQEYYLRVRAALEQTFHDRKILLAKIEELEHRLATMYNGGDEAELRYLLGEIKQTISTVVPAEEGKLLLAVQYLVDRVRLLEKRVAAFTKNRTFRFFFWGTVFAVVTTAGVLAVLWFINYLKERPAVDANNTEVQNLRQEVDQLQQNLTTTQNLRNQIDRQLQATRLLVLNRDSQIRDLQVAGRNKDARIRALTRERNEAQEQIGPLRDERDRLTEQLENTQGDLEGGKRRLQLVNQRNGLHLNEINRLNDSLLAMVQKCEHLQRDLTDAIEQIRNLEAERDGLNAQANAEDRVREGLVAEVQQLRQRAAESEQLKRDNLELRKMVAESYQKRREQVQAFNDVIRVANTEQ